MLKSSSLSPAMSRDVGEINNNKSSGSETSLSEEDEERRPNKIIRRDPPVKVTIRMANKKQGCQARFRLPLSSRTTPMTCNVEEEEAECSDADEDEDEGGEADDDNSDNPTEMPSTARRPRNKRYWRVEDHNTYQRRLVLKNIQREQQEKKKGGRRKKTGALITQTSSEADESGEDANGHQPGDDDSLRQSVGNNETGELQDADLRQAFEISTVSGGNKTLNELEDSTDPSRHDKAVEEIIKTWQPKLPIIVLFFRWAQRPANHFNSDSISLVKTLANQCRFTPLRLIADLKNYYFRTNTKERSKCPPFGFRLNFAEGSSSNDRLISAETATALQGLQYAFSYLQQQVLAQEDSMRGKIGMRKQPAKIQPESSNDNSGAPGTSVIHTHTPDAFQKRVWLELEHRVLAYHVVRKVVHATNSRSSFKDREINATNILSLSFAALSPCKERRYFVDVLAKLCLLIDDKEAVKNHPSFQDVWATRRDNPQALVDVANAVRMPEDEIVRKVNGVFQYLRNQSRSVNLSLTDDVRNVTKQWAVIRARVFSIWLKDFQFNAKLLQVVTRLAVNDLCPDDNNALSEESDEDADAVIQQSVNMTGVYAAETEDALTDDALTDKKQSPWISTAAQEDCITLGQFLRRTNDKTDGGDTAPPTAAALPNKQLDDEAASPTTESCVLQHQRHGLGFMRNDVAKIKSLRPPSRDEMDTHLQSHLIIYANMENYVLQMAPVEVYSAGDLWLHKHERRTSSAARLPGSPPSHVDKLTSCRLIRSSCPVFVDRSDDILHVARPGSSIFDNHARECSLSRGNDVVRVLLQHGAEDASRSPGALRLNFGCGGLSFDQGTGAPSQLVGVKFLEKLSKDDRSLFLTVVGTLTKFVWDCMNELQSLAGKPNLATNQSRNQYSNKLCDLLHLHRSVPVENVTLSLSNLSPIPHQCNTHVDKMNDTLYSYSKTGTLNMALVDDADKSFYLFQVIVNFRSVVSNYCMPSVNAIKKITRDAKLYEERMDSCYQNLFLPWVSVTRLPTLFDRTNFWLDDCLFPEDIRSTDIGGNEHGRIEMQLLLIPIGISRTMSMSMAIDPIVKLIALGKLNDRQAVELCFAASLLNQPLRFHYVMELFAYRAGADESFSFQEHSFHDWLSSTKKEFGGQWQGGPFNRFSPHRQKDIEDLFGKDDGGLSRLTTVGDILIELIEFVNTFAETTTWGNTPSALKRMRDGVIDKDVLNEKFGDFLEAIRNTCKNTHKGCDFAFFRLAVFLTMANACCLTKPGRHLRQLFLPAPGTAAYRHLTEDRKHSEMSYRRGSELATVGPEAVNGRNSDSDKEWIPREKHDEAMKEIAAGMKRQIYFRDEIECLLCESMPHRMLDCREWYCRGLTLYDMDCDGYTVYKRYGQGNQWFRLYDLIFGDDNSEDE